MGWRGETVTKIVFRVVVEPDEEEGGFVAYVANLPGVYGQGETEEEAADSLSESLDFTIRDMIESGEELPESDESAVHLPSLPTVSSRGHSYRKEMAV
jgi:predicted RNase H-like HicB family nuclease